MDASFQVSEEGPLMNCRWRIFPPETLEEDRLVAARPQFGRTRHLDDPSGPLSARYPSTNLHGRDHQAVWVDI